MKEQELVKAFCQGYLEGALACNADLRGWDDWVIWDKYDINFVGQDYTSEELGETALLAVVYPAGWEGKLPDHLYSFVMKTTTQGESK